MSDEFYIGYAAIMPKATAKLIGFVTLILMFVAGAFAVILVYGQNPFAPGIYEFGNVKEFSGTIQAEPIPFLLVERFDQNETGEAVPFFDRYPLVSEGKFGFDASNLRDKRVNLKGSLIYRDDTRMIEVVSNSVEVVSADDGPKDVAQTLGTHVLKGEIVDSKCYLGVMNPGEAKPHKECAIRCLSGGVPPLFVVKDTQGNRSELWLVAEKRTFLDYVAEPIEIKGEIKRQGDKLFLYPESLTRID